jgi:uncharacterized protein YgbK (DUF1537 family)
MASLVEHTGVGRVAVAGGDTSGHVAQALGIAALSAVAPLAPGAPLCRAYGPDAAESGLEIVLKGGQMGAPDFFCAAKGANQLKQARER